MLFFNYQQASDSFNVGQYVRTISSFDSINVVRMSDQMLDRTVQTGLKRLLLVMYVAYLIRGTEQGENRNTDYIIFQFGRNDTSVWRLKIKQEGIN